MTHLEREQIASAQQMTRGLRALLDSVSRVPPGPQSAELAERIAVLAADVEALAPDDVTPWFHQLDRDARKALIAATAGERTSSAGTSWTEFAPVAPPIALEMHGETASGIANLGAAFCGPPGRVHGGTVATMLDHSMGALLFHLERPSYTARLEIDYRASSPLGADLEVRATVDRIDGRKTWVESTISHDGEVAARGYGLFLLMERG